MDTRILILAAVLVAAALIYFRPFSGLGIVRKKCTATVPGHYVYSEGYYEAQDFGSGVTYMVPVYEYTVNDKPYLIIIEGMKQSYNVFPLEVEVQYNPANPEVSFIDGMRGKIIKKK